MSLTELDIKYIRNSNSQFSVIWTLKSDSFKHVCLQG